MTPDPSAFAEPCAITAGAFCLTHRASTTDPHSEECVAMALHAEVDRLRAHVEAAADIAELCNDGPSQRHARTLRRILNPDRRRDQ